MTISRLNKNWRSGTFGADVLNFLISGEGGRHDAHFEGTSIAIGIGYDLLQHTHLEGVHERDINSAFSSAQLDIQLTSAQGDLLVQGVSIRAALGRINDPVVKIENEGLINQVEGWATSLGVDVSSGMQDGRKIYYYKSAFNKLMRAVEANLNLEIPHPNPKGYAESDPQSDPRKRLAKYVIDSETAPRLRGMLGEDMPDSLEKIALLSAVYNGKLSLGDSTETPRKVLTRLLSEAYRQDDRAEVWYVLRYRTIRTAAKPIFLNGYAKRGAAEAGLFGLYGTSSQGSATALEIDALAAYRMFTRHSEEIIKFEERYGRYIEAAAADFDLSGTAYAPSLIDDELSRAHELLVEKYGVGEDVEVRGIFVGNDLDFYVNGNLLYSKNDLIRSAEGASLIIGGKGNDYLVDKGGNDTYIFDSGWGTDVIDDKGGSGRILIDGHGLPAGKKQSESVWLSTDKAYRYVLIGEGASKDLLVTNITSNDSLIIRNWSPGQFGIQLTDEPADSDEPSIPGATLNGDQDWLFGDGTPVHVGAGDYLAWWINPGPYNSLSPEDDFLYTGFRVGAGAVGTLIGGAGKDLLVGDANANLLDGGDDDDRLFGGAGADVLKGGAGKDILLGGVDYHDYSVTRGAAYADGTLMIFPSFQNPDVYVDNFDRIYIFNAITNQTESDGNDVIDGGAGNDTIDGGYGNDQLKGGADNDLMFGGAGKDFIDGGANDDRLYGDSTTLYSPNESGDDVLVGGDGKNMLFGQGGNDTLVAGKDNDLLMGDYFVTSITPISDHGDDVLDGGAGNDVLIGGGGQDILLGGSDNDKLYGDSVKINDALLEGLQSVNSHFFDHQATIPDASRDGSDRLFGGDGNDLLYGGGGDDTLSGDAGNDTLYGGAGNDTYLVDGQGNDRIVDRDSKNNIVFENGFSMPAPGASGMPSSLSNADEEYTDENGTKKTEKFLIITFASGTTLKVLGGYSNRGNFQLADGTTLDSMQLIAASGTVFDASYVDDEALRIIGTGSDDTIAALTGGYEVLGGKGDDTLVLADDGNTVYYGIGDGTDHITINRASVDAEAPNILKFGVGISASDIKLGLGSLAIHVGNNPDDVIHIENFNPGDVYENIAFDQFEFVDGTVLSYEELLQQGFDIDGSSDSDLISGTNVDDRIAGMDGDDWIEAGEGNNVVSAGNGNDTLISGSGNDHLDAGDGNDYLQGGTGDDTYVGGTGDDTVSDESGSDTYFYAVGDGNDYIIDHDALEEQGIDALYFGEGIDASRLVIERNYHDLMINITDELGDIVGSVTLQGFLDATANQIETVVFANGTQLAAADLVAQSTFIEPPGAYIEGSDDNDDVSGTEGADEIVAQFGDDIVHGDRGDDVIMGGHWDDRALPVTFTGGDGAPVVMVTATDNDTLYGEAGNDRLDGGYRPDHDVYIGGSGDDTYMLHAGSGDDTIIESDDVGNNDIIEVQGATPEQVHVTRDATDLIIEVRTTESSLGNTLDRARVSNFFVDPSAQIERVIVSDPNNPDMPLASWDVATLEAMAAQATQWDDYLIAPEAGGVLAGLAGNDTLVGGIGSDTYEISAGDGIDIISEATNTAGYDVLDFDASVDPDLVRVFRDGDDIVLATGNLDNRVILQGWFSQPDARIEAVSFANGTSWSPADLELRIIAAPTEMDDLLFGDSQDNIIAALDGNDQVYGKEGNDQLHGDAGNDQIHGGDGDDLITGGAGDDALYGDAGNDQLSGGAGHNVLAGGEGDDTYVYAASDGHQVIEDLAGVNTLVFDSVLPDDDIVFSRSADDGDLHIRIAGSESLVIRNWQETQGVFIQRIVFADGTEWDWSDISDNILEPVTPGSDDIHGTPRGDVLDGLGGGDVVSGGDGNDTYVFAPGYGELRIDDYGYDDHDKLLFKNGIRFSDLSFSADQSDLIITIGTSNDRVVIGSFFDFYDQNSTTGLGNTLEHMMFDDGSTVDFSSIPYLFPVSQDPYFHNVFGYGADDTLQGGAADDTLYGGLGNDQLYGDDGIDTLYGGAGNDLLDAGTASAPLSIARESVYDTSGNARGFVNIPGVYVGYAYGAAETLYGGMGDDTYVINADSGIVNIVDTSGNDTVLLGDGIDLSSIVARYNPANHYGQIRIEYQNAQGKPSAFYLNTDTSVTSIQSVSGESVLISDLLHYVLTQQTGSSGSDVLVTGLGPQMLSGGAGDDLLAGGEGRDSLFGGEGNDVLHGGAGNDTLVDDVQSNILLGGAGHDILTGNGELFGGSGNDTLTGYGLLDAGTGNDTLSIRDEYYGAQASVIVFDRGYGHDVVSGGTHSLIFLKNLMPEDIEILGGAVPDRDNHRMTLKIKGSDDRLVGIDSITKITFADGSFWNASDIARMALAPVGTNSNDSLLGTSGNDLINGLAGNDWINGGAGDDVLLGGAGDDKLLGGAGDDFLDGGDGLANYLEGGVGKDTYRLSRHQGTDYLIEVADGSDTIIQVDAGIMPADIVVSRTPTDFWLGTIDPESGQVSNLVLNDWLMRSSSAGQLYIRFSDGTEWNEEQLLDKAGRTYLVETNYYNTSNGLHGSPLNDVLVGTSRDEVVNGFAGDDVLDGGTGDDALVGGEGHDTYLFGYGSGHDSIDMASNADFEKDTIQLKAGVVEADVSITLTTGGDLVITLAGSSDSFTLKQWLTSDTDHRIGTLKFDDGHSLSLKADPQGPLLLSGDDNYFGISATTLFINEQPYDDIVYGMEGNDRLYGGSGDDRLYGGEGNDILSGGRGSNIMEGGAGSDFYQSSAGVHGTTDTIILGRNTGRDSLWFNGDANGKTPLSIAFQSDVAPGDIRISLDQRPSLSLNGMSFVLAVSVDGGDTQLVGIPLQLDLTTDQVTLPVRFVFADGTEWNGTDILQKSLIKHTGGDSNFFVGDTSRNGELRGSTQDDVLLGLSENDVLIGNAGNDYLLGGGGSNRLSGGDGDDLLFGGSGEDILEGGRGNDTLIGGNGSNTYLFSKKFGMDVIGLQQQEHATIQFNDGITARDVVLQVRGTDIAISIAGDTGSELLVQGALSIVDLGGISGKFVTSNMDAIVFADGTRWTPNQILTHLGFSTPSDDDIFLNNADSLASGGFGDDALVGSNNNDLLYGGEGSDRLAGGAGNDLLEGGQGSDTYVFNAGDGTDEIRDAGNAEDVYDTLVFGKGILPANISRQVFGNDITLTLNSGDSITIRGGMSADLAIERILFADGTVLDSRTWQPLPVLTMAVGQGSISLLRSQQLSSLAFEAGITPDQLQCTRSNNDLIIALGNGDDRWIFQDWFNNASVPTVLSALFASGEVWFSDDFSRQASLFIGTGGDDQLIAPHRIASTLSGAAGNDYLQGGAMADLLEGGAGNDTLNGGIGTDVMRGGTGDDIYWVDSVTDTVLEGSGEGHDLVMSSVSMALQDNIEDLSLIGGNALNATGNELDNILTGNALDNHLDGLLGNDTLDGGVGADYMAGGDGNDSYYVDNYADVVDETTGTGSDTVFSSITYTLADNLENLTLLGDGRINGTGNQKDNIIVGNADNNVLYGLEGNDVIRGGVGADVMVGGLGDDQYYVDNVNDNAVENDGEGSDTVFSSVSYSLAGALENLTLTGSGALAGYGNDSDNVLTGNDGANVLHGEAGDDRLDGGAGDDTLVGGSGNDTYVFRRQGGIDTLVDTTDINSGAGDSIEFAAGITPGDIVLMWRQNDLVVSVRGETDRMVVQGFRNDSNAFALSFQNGTTWSREQILTLANTAPVDQSPQLTGTLGDIGLVPGTFFSTVLPPSTFSDPDQGDTLAWRLTLADGSPLPSWLHFDQHTLQLSGTPESDDVGLLTLRASVMDAGGLTTATSFRLNIRTPDAPNHAPVLVTSLEDQAVTEGQRFEFLLPAHVFVDIDFGDAVTVTASLADGSALPEWLSFDAQSGTFSGVPTSSAAGTLDIQIRGTDKSGDFTSTTFQLAVADRNLAPVADHQIPDILAVEDQPLSITIPANLFVDPDGDSIIYSVKGADGQALPSWLHYDAAQNRLYGSPGKDQVGSTAVSIVADDGQGHQTEQQFNVVVRHVNHAPVIAYIPAPLEVTEDENLYLWPEGMVVDPDWGDQLTYTLKLVSGSEGPGFSPVPARRFDLLDTAKEVNIFGVPVFQYLSGNYVDLANDFATRATEFWDVGTWTYLLTVTDRSGESAQQNITIEVKPSDRNHAPLVLPSLTEGGDQNPYYGWLTTLKVASREQGDRVSINIVDFEKSMFVDVDGDPLTYGVIAASNTDAVSNVVMDWDTHSLSFTVEDSGVRAFDFYLTATDSHGAVAQHVEKVLLNRDPEKALSSPLDSPINIQEGNSLFIQLPQDLFMDRDGDPLQISIGSAKPNFGVPAFLNFDPYSMTLSGVPGDFDVGVYDYLFISAQDQYGGSVQIPLHINVTNTYDAPRFVNPLSDLLVYSGQSISVETSHAFQEVDEDQTLTYTVTLVNGNALPSWLSIDADTGFLHGAPAPADVGEYSVRVFATDLVGGVASDDFVIGVYSNQVNHAPVLSQTIADRAYRVGSEFSFALPQGTFIDVDPGDVLTYQVSLMGDVPLPSWLHFNAVTQSFSGTIPSDQQTPVQIIVKAFDRALASAEGSFVLGVATGNAAPYVVSPVAAIHTLEDSAFTWVLPVTTFADDDAGETLTYSITQLDGSPLPPWLHFDPITNTLQGTPYNADVGSLSLLATATDSQGAIAATQFNLDVGNVNDAPVLVHAPQAPEATQGQVYSYQLPADVFEDIDAGDVLSYAVTQADGSALPSWLSFDPLTRVLSGTPVNGDVGLLSLRVVATDIAGVSADAAFSIAVANINDAPVVADATVALYEDTVGALSGNLLGNASDVDQGDVLSAVAGVFQGQYGVFTLNVDGNWQYQPDTASLQSLALGEQVLDGFTYQVSDGHVSSPGLLRFVIDGRNDTPVVAVDYNNLLEDQPQASGNVLLNDHDVDHGAHLAIASAGDMQGNYGSLHLDANGTYVYTADNANLQALAAGESVTDHFDYVVSDGIATASSGLDITVTGSNDAPVAQADIATTTVGAAVLMGNLLTNDSDVDHGAVLQAVAASQQGQYGTLFVETDGSYRYVLDESLPVLAELAEGEILTESFVYGATDGELNTAGTLAVTIVGRNDFPVVTGELVTLDEDRALPLTGNVLINDSDVDHCAVLQAVSTTLQGQYGILSLQANGSWSYQTDHAALQSLAVGDQVVDVFNYQVTDGQATTPGELRFMIDGRNDTPVITVDLAVLSEDQSGVSGNVLANDSDVDHGTQLSVVGAGNLSGSYGVLHLAANGTYVYEADNTHLQSLAAGETVTEHFGYAVTDGVASVTSGLDITVQGRNDAPVAHADAVTAAVSVGVVNGNALINDSDVDHGAVLKTIAEVQQGQYGSLNLDAAGNFRYDINASSSALKALAAGESVSESFSYTLTDGSLDAHSTISITLQGSNDAPTAVADGVVINEDQPQITGNVLANDSDPDHNTVLQVAAPGPLAGQYGTLTLQANGQFSYALNNSLSAVQALGSGQTLTETFAYRATDGELQSFASSLVVTISGRNDAPVAAIDNAQLVEDNITVAVGNVLGNDSDIDTGTVLVVQNPGEYQGSYGRLVLGADGAYRYELANASAAVQALAANETVTEHFQYTVADGAGADKLLATSELLVTVTGRNDAPVVVSVIAGQTTQIGQAYSLVLPSGMFSDVDHGDTVGYSVTKSDGSALPSWLQFNSATRTLSGTATGAAANFQLRVTATDSFGAQTFSDFALTVSGDGECHGQTINGTIWNDVLIGGNCADVIDGSGGADVMFGKGGDDTYLVDNNLGLGAYNGPEACDFSIYLGDQVVERANEGYDTVKSTVSYVLPQHVEALKLEGSFWISGTGNSLDNWIQGNAGNNNLEGGEGNDHILGGAGNDSLAGGIGTDLLQGGSGNDALSDAQGNGLLDGGDGADSLSGNAQSNLFIGGKGDDSITLGGGQDVVSFNKGDGRDVITDAGYAGGSLVVSLGGGIQYTDLKFHRLGADLVLETGNSDAITFQGWYGLLPNRPTVTLQAVAESMPGFSQASSNTKLDDKLETFNLNQLAAKFDQQGWTNLWLTPWSLNSALTQFQLSGSDTAALGGNLAYQYGMTGSIAGVGAVSAQSELASTLFGAQAQALKPLSGLSDGISKLS